MKIGIFDSGVGLVPFIKEILNQDKRNDFYVFLDHDFFPYGDKTSDELALRLIDIFKFFEKNEIDELYIMCNTMSYIYSKVQIPSSFKVKTILEYNLKKYDQNSILLCTPYLATHLKKFYNIKSGKNLASLIENNSLEEIKQLIYSFHFHKNVILGCTHYPMVKNIFKEMYPNLKIFSYEKEFIEQIPSKNKRRFFVNKSGKKVIKKYFPLLRIKTIIS